MVQYRISVAIRTYNEQKHLREVLESLQSQTYQNFETILLDSGSTDDTVAIASDYPVRIERIPQKAFNYSYASNLLVSYATGDIVCFISGHSVPVHCTYLEELNAVFQDPQVGGCYGDVIALPDASLTERLFHGLGYVKNKLLSKHRAARGESQVHPGIFSCCNAAARKELLLRHPFALELGSGGEDIEVAYRILEDGYRIERIPELLVRHSHGKKLPDFIREYLGWKRMWKDALRYIEIHPESTQTLESSNRPGKP